MNGEERQLLVAIKASSEMPRSAVVWALTHVVQPGDCLKLLVIIPVLSHSKHFYVFCIYIYMCVCCTCTLKVQ